MSSPELFFPPQYHFFRVKKKEGRGELLRGTVGLIKDSFAKERVGWEEKGSHSEVIVFETFPLAENNCCGFP